MYFLGLISGTSVDGIDAVIINDDDKTQLVLAADNTPYPEPVRLAVESACRLAAPGYEDVATLDQELGQLFAEAALRLIRQAGINKASIVAIGSHGQTVHHAPYGNPPYSLQLASGEQIANMTGITTVCDFRSADMAAGGQGAPMVPAFHAWLAEGLGKPAVFLNIGGIANITVLDEHGKVTGGFDTGPGNTLMDRWIELHQQLPYDRNGQWAASGTSSTELVSALLDDPYFSQTGPKSTGREVFNLPWLNDRLARLDAGLPPEDVQASLLELSSETISRAILALPMQPASVYVCGGGVHNTTLMNALQNKLHGIEVTTTRSVGLDPDWVEAAAFAWLARETLAGRPGNVPAVTGATQAVVLGKVYHPAKIS